MEKLLWYVKKAPATLMQMYATNTKLWTFDFASEKERMWINALKQFVVASLLKRLKNDI